ncbi:MAG: leucine-rich repeat protein [Bacteroidaceae bacterium]|nr:leucine-rich repeat protein [Bacteroidaceae bacterium]
MKKFSSLLLLVALLIIGCTDDMGITGPVNTDSNISIEIRNEINQVPVTRVNDEGFCDGDAVGIYVVNYNEDAPGTLQVSGNQADNVKYTYSEAEQKWTPEYDVFYYDKVTPVDIIGYYPYGAPADVQVYPFEVARDQSTDAANGLLGGYEASDFLWGKVEKSKPIATKVNISFHHRMAGVQVELIEGTGFADGEWNTIEKEVLVSNTKRNATINLSTGEVTATGEVPTTGIVPHKSEGMFRAVVVPQTVEASTALFNITVDGTSYIYRKNESMVYISGKLHKFTIEVSKKGQDGLVFKLLGESIIAWENENITHDGSAREYVVIHVPKASTDESSALKKTFESSGKDFSKIINLKVTGEINEYDFYFMRDEMSALQSVNLKEVEVVEKEIPSEAFSGKSLLTRFVFPENIGNIGDSAFQGTNLAGSLILPNSITEIGDWAFYLVASLSGTLSLPKSLKEIGAYSFYFCQFSGQLQIPNSVITIGQNAFSGNNFSGSLQLPEELEILGAGAFSVISNITGSLKIPEKIKIINSQAFAYCGFDGDLILPHSLLEVQSRAFVGCCFRGNLQLPASTIIIGESAFSLNSFSGTLKLPSSLMVIGSGSFYGCNLTGIVEIPEGITSIPQQLFGECTKLEGVVIPKSVESIGTDAFYNCYQLNSITCHALTPPTLTSTAFNGVAKDNFAVEVPEASIAEYTTAPNWNEFKRIAAHRDFTISRNLFRALNAENNKTLVLRAPSGESWSIESKPDWVTVTPESGVGKTEVTITVDELAMGGGNRDGEVVFLLDGKDYRARTKVEQYDYEYGDGDVITYQSATKGNGVNLVFMGDCFDAKDITEGKYLDGTSEAIEHFFAVEPYKTYREYFNVYIVFGLSPDSGMGTVNTIREAKFGSQYTLGEGIAPDETICFEYACKAPTVAPENISETVLVLIENSSEYGGICYMWDDGSAIAVCPMSEDAYPYDFRGLVQHEAGGHGFGKLGDEYIYCNAFITNCPVCGDASKPVRKGHSLGWYQNLWLTGNMYEVPWSHLIFDEKYQNTVDIYEGGYMHTRGIFRSEPTSCMNNNIPYFSAISREEIVKRIKRYAGEEYSFEEWKANDVALATRSSELTRSLTTYGNYLSSRKQHEPRFMGEKPNIKSNK